MKKVFYIIGVIILIAGLSACARTKIETVKPYYGKIQKSFTELAKTRLAQVYDVNMPLSGDLARIVLEPGDAVQKGQMIAQLIQTPWQQAVDASHANLKTVQASYVYQTHELKRIRKLAASNFVTKSVLDNAIAEEKVLQAKLKQAEADLKVAEYNLQQSTLHSSIDGVVLKRFTVGQQWLTAGTPIMQLGNLNELEVICDVLSQQAQQLKVGGPVLLSSIGSPVVLGGKIKRIEPAGFTKKSSLGVDEQRVNVITSIDDHQGVNLGVEFRLQATFLIGSKDNHALIVPRFSVLQDNQNNFYVFKIVKSRLVKQIVKVGIETDEKFSITDGLTEDDIIAAQPTADMKSGDKV